MSFLGGARTPLALGLVAIFGLGGCGGAEHPKLDALESDPMATVTFAHTSLADDAKTAEGTTLGKPVHAQITRRFSFSGVEPQRLVDTAGALAVHHGWAAGTTRPQTFEASKTVDGVTADLLITVAAYQSSQALFVYITARN
jgi:hypothetical protein